MSRSDFFLGIDLGSSSVKTSLFDSTSGKSVDSCTYPSSEMEIISKEDGWAEQDPNYWWDCILKTFENLSEKNDFKLVRSIGISYQMHGLVVLDKNNNLIYNSIIWCDSRAVKIGQRAESELESSILENKILNSPGNFTASKLRWLKENRSDVYDQISKIMLPGDYIVFKLTNKISTTPMGLSEGILWDFHSDKLSEDVLEYYNIDRKLIPEIVDSVGNQGTISDDVRDRFGFDNDVKVTYRAGDQPNNALALNVFDNGEVAASGGTSGVIYSITKDINSKEPSRINHFAHVNYNDNNKSIGKLLCINGAGIQYRWLRNHSVGKSYEKMNEAASSIPVGSEGISVIPFGNGAERMLNNKNIGTHICNINLNQHSHGHLYRSSLEGIAFSFMYGMEILKNDNALINVVRAGNDNLFRSKIFANTVATLIGHEIEIYNTTGAFGAARASGVMNDNLDSFRKKITKNDHVMTFLPLKNTSEYEDAYSRWKEDLQGILKNK